MASAKDNSNKATAAAMQKAETTTTDLANPSLDSGFEEQASGAAGWWQIDEGAKFTGILLDRQRRHDWVDNDPKTHQYTYLMEATQACIISRGADEADEEVEAGTVVMVDEKSQLSGLAGYMKDPPGSWAVQIIALEKISIKKGKQSMWQLKWGVKPLREGLTKPKKYDDGPSAPQTTNAGASASVPS